MNLDWHMQRDGENMSIEDFIKSLTYEQKVGLIWALFYDACEMSKSMEDITSYPMDPPVPMYAIEKDWS